MSGFCFCVGENAIKKLLDTGFQSKQVADVLHGQVEVEVGVKTVKLDWEVTDAPVVGFGDLAPETEAWDENGNNLTFVNSMFIIQAGVRLSVEGGTPSNIIVDVVALPQVINNIVCFAAVGIVNRSDYASLDRGLLKGIVKPLLGSINKVLGFDGGAVPEILSLDKIGALGVPVSDPMFVKKGQRMFLVTGAGGDQSIVDAIPNTGKDVSIALASDAITSLMDQQLDEVKSEYSFQFSLDDTTKVGILGHFGVRMSVSGGVSKVGCVAVEDSYIGAGLWPTLSFAGHVVLFGTNASGAGYDFSFNPTPITAKAFVYVNDSLIKVVLDDFDSFTVILKPTGNWIEQVESYLAWPLEEAIINSIIAAIRGNFRKGFGITFPIKDLEFSMYSMSIKLVELSNSYSNKTMIIDANVDAQLNQEDQ